MKGITINMINEYKLKELGHDFMGYKIEKDESLEFHHLIIPRRQCDLKKIPNDGYVEWNGAILKQKSHAYLHLTEIYSPEIFYAITSEMIDMNIKGYLDEENLKEINSLLLEFEKKFSGVKTKKGKILIKERYKQGRVFNE